MSLTQDIEYKGAPDLLTRTLSTPQPSTIQPFHLTQALGHYHHCMAHCLVKHSLNTATHIMNTLAGKDPSLI